MLTSALLRGDPVTPTVKIHTAEQTAVEARAQHDAERKADANALAKVAADRDAAAQAIRDAEVCRHLQRKRVGLGMGLVL